MRNVTRNKMCIISVIILLVTILGIVGYKVVKHENAQKQQILELMGKTDYLGEKLRQMTDYYEFQTEYSTEAYNYLAIGNSLTLIPSWGRGICSTQPDNDYFNLVVANLKEKHGKVVAYSYNYSPWERALQRDNTFDLIDIYLDDKLDFITIQLGENVSDVTTYKNDLESLIGYVHKKAPKAKIIIIGDWWDVKRNQMRMEAAGHTNCTFVDLSDVIGKKEYQSLAGSICYLKDGSTIEVSKAAETHPGDKGMRYIADKVIEKI